MSLTINLNRNNNVALYRQIAEQVKSEIGRGQLPGGARLPTVRQLARELGVTRLTVQNAYGDLQSGGWIEATVGRGTFVSREHPMPSRTSAPLTAATVIDEMMQVEHAGRVRSMAIASPDVKLAPMDEFLGALQSLQRASLLQAGYESTQGNVELRLALVDLLRERGIDAMPGEILITSGATQAFSLAAQALAQPGDVVLVEQPTYLGFLNALKAQGLRPVGVPLDEDGLDLEALTRLAAQHRPRFLYTIPTFQNPTGLCASLEQRRALLAVARRFGILIVEDDIYASLSYDGPIPPSLYALDDSNVIYLSSLSKSLIPSLRIGYIVAPQPIYDRLVTLKRASDLFTSTLMQQPTARFLCEGGLKRHLRRVLPVYGERRNALHAALQRHMPSSVQWTRPAGGFCCWLTLPRHRNLMNLYQLALARGLAVAPGEVFLSEPSTQLHLRLTFGNQPSESIESGVEMLGELIRERVTAAPAEAEDWMPLV